MTRILPILKGVGRGFQVVAIVSIVAMNLLMGYIMFAPDQLPKPFYLNYKPGGASLALPFGATPTPAGPKPTPSPTQDPLTLYKPGEGLMVDTGSKIINLADPGGRRYLKTTITLEVVPPPGVSVTSTVSTATSTSSSSAGADSAALTAFNDKMNSRMPVINDTLTTLLSSKTFDSIYTVQGKEELRTEIQKELNSRMPDLYVISVYFTEFVVQ